MDACYAIVKQRDYSKYRGRPVIVGTDLQELRNRAKKTSDPSKLDG
jgi:hypothetical protein